MTASGGVSYNSGLHRELQARCDPGRTRASDRAAFLCTDNAAMVGILAERSTDAGCCANAAGQRTDSRMGTRRDLTRVGAGANAALEPHDLYLSRGTSVGFDSEGAPSPRLRTCRFSGVLRPKERAMRWR